MSKFSFQEKMLWVQLAGLLVLGGFYAHMWQHSHGPHYFHAVLIVALLLFALVRWLARRRSGNVVADERDRLIACQGARWSNNVLWLGLIVILVAYSDHGDFRSSPFLIGILFHLLLLAGLVRIVREMVAYRRAA